MYQLYQVQSVQLIITLSIQLITLLCLAAAVRSQFIPCDEGFHWHEGICYHIAPGSYRHEAAQYYCNKRRSTLLILHDNSQLDYLRSEIMGFGYYWQRLWLGLVNNNGVYHWKYTDNIPNNTNWMIGNPTFESGVAVNVFTGEWADKDFANTDAANVVCMYPEYNSPNDIPYDPVCKANYYGYNGQCYTVSNNQMTYTQAMKTCQNDNASLVQIHSHQEEMFIVKKALERVIPELPRTIKLWIGLNLKEGEYKWQSANQWQIVDYTHWDEKSPSKRSDRVHMVIKDEKTFGWSDEEIYSNAGYICSYYP